jgi:site-specific recombinase XerC
MFKLLRRLHPTLTEPADLTKPTLNQFVVKMRERGLSAVSCNTRLKAVNVFVASLHTEACSRRNSTSRRSGPRSECFPSSAPSR